MIRGSLPVIKRTPRVVFDGFCYDWDMDHEWIREHRDPLISRVQDPTPGEPYRAWDVIIQMLRRKPEDWD